MSGRAAAAGKPWRLCRLALLLAAVLAAAPAWAATDTVTSIADSGVGSLRNTIAAAASGDTIAFNLTTPTTITLSSGPLLVAKNLTFSGPGYADLTISGGTTVQIMQVSGGIALSISGLSFTHGTANVSQTDGAFLDLESGSASLTQCWVSSNSMPDGGGLGGAIYAGASTTLTIEDCTFIDNTVTASGAGSAEGGAIFGDTGSTITINRSTLSANNCYCPGCGAGPDNPLDVDGGAIYDIGRLTLNGCLVSGNHADDHDGALAWYGTTATLTNCTFSGNSGVEEGAVAAFAAGQMSLLNCTITDNTSQNFEAGLSGYDDSSAGGGVTVQNCVIAGNVAADMEGDDPNDVDIFVDINGDYGAAETLASGGYNLVGESGSQTYTSLETGDGKNDSVGVNDTAVASNLASLANNGGYAETVGFSSTSGVPANPGSSNGAPLVDGRGYLRPGSNPVSSEGAYQENGSLPAAEALSAASVSGFTANWTTVGGVTGYYLDVATDAAFNNIVSGYDGRTVAESGATTTSQAVTGLSSGTTYYYRVRAYLSPYISWYSNTASGSTLVPSPTVTRTRTPTSTPTHSPSPTVTETGTATPSPTDTATVSPSFTVTASSTATPSSTPTATFSNSPTATASATPTGTFSNSPTPTATFSSSPTATPSSTPTRTFSNSPTATRSPTPTGTFSNSPTNTASFTPTASFSDSPTATRSSTPTVTFSSSPTATRSPSSTASPSSTPSPSATATATQSFTRTSTWTASATPSATPTVTDSPTVSPTWTASSTRTETATPGPTSTAAAFLASGQGKIILGPVPARRGEPICLYMNAPPSSSQWTVYSMDQTVVARLSFGSEASQCWTDTGTLAPGVYWVHLSVTYASGATANKVLKIMVIN